MVLPQKQWNEKSAKNTSKDEVERSLNFKTNRDNFMYNFFYTNVSHFSENLELMLEYEIHKRTIKNALDCLEE